MLVVCLLPQDVSADLVLQLEEVGYDQTTVIEKDEDTSPIRASENIDDRDEPAPEVLRAVEVLIRPGERFSAVTRAGKQKLSVRGICKRGEQPDELQVELFVLVDQPTG